MASSPPPANEQIDASRSILASLLGARGDLEFAVLIGSRATGSSHANSDWDIALQWSPQISWEEKLGRTETLRHDLAAALQVAPDAVDLIDMWRANLAMRASVAEEGKLLAVRNTLSWGHFLKRVWRDLEDYYWDKQTGSSMTTGTSTCI